jgi:hypothetical protein
MLSHAVLSVIKSIHIYDVVFDLWNVESVGLPSVVM